MSDSSPKHYWNLIKELKELDANSVMEPTQFRLKIG